MPKAEPDRAKSVRCLTGTLGWAGVGVLAATVVFVGWAWLGLGGEGTETDSAVNPRWGASVMVLGVFGIVLVRHLRGQGADPDPAQPRSRSRDHLLFPLFLVVTAVVLVFVALPTDSLPPLASPRAFTASEQAIALWGVAVLVALGTVLSLGVFAGPREKPRGLWWVGAPAGVLVVVLVAGLVTPLSEYRPITHSFLAEVPGEPAPFPSDVTRAGWTWAPPEDAEVVRVDAGSHGPVVVLADGLVGLDGETGEELWVHRAPYASRPGRADAGVLDADPALAYTDFDPNGAVPSGRLGGQTYRRLLLDTGTGQIVEKRPDLGASLLRQLKADPSLQHSTRDAHVFVSGAELLALAPDGEVLWSRPAGYGDTPAEHRERQMNEGRYCTAYPDGFAFFEELVVVGELCAHDVSERIWAVGDRYRKEVADAAERSGTVSVFALDTTTGEEVWRRDWEPGDRDPGYPEYPPTPEFRGLSLPGTDPLLLARGRLLDPRTGADSPAFGGDLSDLDPQAVGSDLVLWRADSEGTLFVEYGSELDDGSSATLLYRIDASGALQDTTTLTLRGVDEVLKAARPLEAGLVRAAQGRLSGGSATVSLAVTPLGEGGEDGEGTVGLGDERRFEVTTDLFADVQGQVENVRHELTPVPGAMVVSVSGSYEGEYATQIVGLVP
jgi:outer membrane protein assembly factor BamB